MRKVFADFLLEVKRLVKREKTGEFHVCAPVERGVNESGLATLSA
jgi:hypothetical protein